MTTSKIRTQLKPDMPYSKMVEETSTSEDISDPVVQQKVDSLLDFFKETGIPYEKFDPDFLKGTNLHEIEESSKKAYPNMDYFMYVPGQHDTQKWLHAVKEIYYGEKNGLNRVVAVRKATNGWNVMETHDFLNWLKYYEEGAHLKYKFAQNWYENGAPGYFLHIKQDPKKEEVPSVGGRDIDMARDAIADEMPQAEKKRIIEKQRNKIVGRLDSAEKLLRTHEGQLFAGKEFESLLETIYQLKKKVQMVNKLSTSTRLYEDMIIREANILNRRGFKKAAEVLFSVAQANNPPPPGTGSNEDTPPLPPPPPEPEAGAGASGGLPSVGPGMPQNPPESAPQENAPGISEFLKNMETGNIGVKDNQSSEDTLEVEDTLSVTDSDSAFMTVAQEVEVPPPAAPVPAPAPIPKVEEPLEVEEKNIGEQTSEKVKDFDNMIDSAFANITINDIVAKLEDIAKIYKTREIPRQLAIVDMMLDSKGLAAYFPSLSEAINKALESNNYIATRIDDILAKLQGGIEGRDIDLKGERQPASPDFDAMKQSLKNQDDKERARKKLRKEQADQELEETTNPKETPEIDIEEDLSKPVPPPRETPPPAPPLRPRV